MKKFIQENWFKIGLLAILVVSVASAFYLFEYRPTKIKERCFADAHLAKNTIINAYYNDCLMRFGLK